ncbi:hypothetical protein [Shinella pollutisoli]|uniref:hypothetical protein n=1 Tax=Shinella pollutisoli TaxID=2250594 RepID=UPI0021487F7A|nr:hypothetical protein [Shinella pollutisoli]
MEARTPPTVTFYDDAERGRIRAALRRYLAQNGIGAPKLRDLIADANGLAFRKDGGEPIALSTVQRFITGKHRVNDSFVRLCARFAEGLPGDDPVAVFGEQLTAFLGVRRGEGEFPPVPAEVAGSYTCHAKRALPTGQLLRLLPKGNPADLVPFSRIEIDLIPDRPFASIRETIENWGAAAPTAADIKLETPPRRSYVGIVACPEGLLFALMRNVTTGMPRVYWLAQTGGNGLGGYGHESISNLDSGEAIERAVHTTTQVALSLAKEAV